MTARQEKKFEVFRKKHPGPERTADFYRDAYETCFDPKTNKVDLENMTILLGSYDDPDLAAECLEWTKSFNEGRDEMMRIVSSLTNRERSVKADAVKKEGEKSETGKKELDLHLDRLSDCKEKETEWLFPMLMPVGDITILAGDGGTGKTLVWNAIAAAVSSGSKAFFEQTPEEFTKDREPGTVIYFSSEDSTEYSLAKRIRLAKANLNNVYFIDLKDDRFTDIKFNSELLREIILKYKPALVILDPLQAFLPPEVQMSSRNAMRAALSSLTGIGEMTRTSFLIIVHTNKRQGVFGRNRVADSADIWDIARSVLIIGKTQDDQRYLSQEKSNYGPLAETVIFRINEEGQPELVGFSEKKDVDFVRERDTVVRQAPQKEEAKEYILDQLQNGKMEVKKLEEMATAAGFTYATLKRAKQDLNTAGLISIWSEGFNPKVYFIALKKNKNCEKQIR